MGSGRAMDFWRALTIGALLVAMTAGVCRAGQFDDHLQRHVQGAQAADRIPVSESAEVEDGELVFAPVPIVDPTVGNGLAGAALYTFNADEENRDIPRSTLGAAIAYTDTDSWLAGAGGQFFLAEDRHRVRLIGAYGNLNLDYYGTSSDSVFFDHPVGFNVHGSVLDMRAQTRIADNFYAGIAARRIDANVSLNVLIDRAAERHLSFHATGLGPIGSYDTRDSTWYPTTGDVVTVTAMRFGTQLVFDDAFNVLDANASRYWSLRDDIVLAANARIAYSGDSTPFFMLPYVNFRGFPAGQYLNNAVVQAQSEVRWMFAERFGAVAFGGIGAIAPSFSEMDNRSNAYGVGIGVRYELSETDRMNIAFDVAYGSNDDVALYFHVGEAF